MAAPVRYLSGRQQQQKIGIEGSTQDEKVLEVVGRVGIGTTIFEPSKQLDVRGDVIVSGELTVGDTTFGADFSTRNLSVSGVSTFTGAIDANGDLDVDGHTELDDVNVSGASTFTGAADFNGDIDVDGHTELDFVNVSAASTFVGFATFSDYVFVQDGLNVAGIITATSFDGLGQIGVGSEGTFIGVGITMVDFKSSNASNTVDVDGTSGIATVTVTTGVSLGLAIALGG